MMLPVKLALGLLVSAALVGAAEPQPPTVRLGSLAKRCSFQLGKTKFNLCPILEGNDGGWTVQWETRTPPTVTKTTYRIDLRGPLQRDANVPREEQVSAFALGKSGIGVGFSTFISARNFMRWGQTKGLLHCAISARVPGLLSSGREGKERKIIAASHGSRSHTIQLHVRRLAELNWIEVD